RAGVPQRAGHARAVARGRRLARAGRRGLRLPHRGPRAVCVGRGPGRGHAPPGDVRLPARVRARATETEIMSRLRIFDEGKPDTPRLETREHTEISKELGRRGVRFEQWRANAKLEPGASPDEVIAAYRDDIARLKREKNYQAMDVLSLNADHPAKAMLRQKFLNGD